ncbi:hypothetical protein DFS34DRAFT_166252 [Phlyctochytrium arcticum]|nr:hypothetical protein DFS34DRAFT_166252 [Phlyctochytrium arcticum]
MAAKEQLGKLVIDEDDDNEDPLPYNRLRRAAKMLATDFTCCNCSLFEVAWQHILKYLESHEPAMRAFVLQCILMMSKSLGRTMIGVGHRRQLVSILAGIATSDEAWQNRCFAARILGEAVPLMTATNFPPVLRKLAFQAVVDQLLQVFPANLDETLKNDPTALDSSHYLQPQVFRMRIHLLHAIAKFLPTPESKATQFAAYFDKLLSSLLRPKAHHYFQAAAVHIIHQHLPVTNRNRVRVEKLFRGAITELSHNALPPELLPSEPAATDSAEPQPAKAMVNPVVAREIARFWSVWYPHTGDQKIVAIAPTPEQMGRITGGYVHRRWRWLMSDALTMPDGSTAESITDEVKRKALEKVYKQSFVLGTEKMAANLEGYDFRPGTAIRHDKASSTSTELLPAQVTEILEPEVAFDIPDPTLLTFNLTPPVLLLNRYPFQKDIFLQNKSLSQDMTFRIQVGPTNYFQAWPTFGTLQKGESATITVRFTPCPHIARKNPEVVGFMRVRTADGIPLERVTLRAYNLPAVKAYPQRLDFGMCPTTDSRVMTFTIVNLVPTDCPIVMLVMPSAHSSMFQITPTQSVLLPKERKHFHIKFTPTADVGTLSELLLLVAFGGEVSRIRLQATAGQALQVLDSKIDFGPTDIYYRAVTRSLVLKNASKRDLPVVLESSTDELVLNHDIPLILEPFEERKVIFQFLSAITGTRQEAATLLAPHSIPHVMDIQAFSGPAILVPVMETIIFPSTWTFQSSSVLVPIVNLSNGVTQCLVTMPVGSPFSVKLADVEMANRRPPIGALVIESKPYDSPEAAGINLTIGARLTAILEITFFSAAWGTFKTPVTVSMTRPRKWPVTTLQLNAISVNDLYLSREKPIEFLRRFLANPASEAATGLLVKKAIEVQESSQASKTSEVFEMDPPLQTVFGATLSSRFEDVCEFVTITNVTSVTQKYHIALSRHFYTDMPLTGELEGMSSIEILVRLDMEYLEQAASLEARNNHIIGSITVFDGNEGKTGMVSTALHGILGNLVSLECREGVDLIKYPSLKVMEKYAGKFILRNRAPFDVVWEGRMVSVGQQGTGLQSDGLPMIVPTSASSGEWCPFNLSVPRVTLKPFEFYTIDIGFQATSSGEYRAKLFMEYVDPVTHVVNSERLRGKAKRGMHSLLFKCSVGTRDLAFTPEFVQQGDVVIGEKGSADLTIINNQPLNLNLALSIVPPFQLRTTWETLSKQTKLDLPIAFEPLKSRAYSELLIVMFGGISRFVSVLGSGGKFGVGCNLAKPMRIDNLQPIIDKDGNFEDVLPEAENIFDFGFVESGLPKNKIVILTNTGTFDYTVKNLALSDESTISWRFMEDAGGDNVECTQPDPWASGFGSEKPDDPEPDWDEIDFRAKESGPSSTFDRRSASTTSQAAPVRRKRYKSISQSIIQPPSTTRMFPFRLPPYQSCAILMSMAGYEKGQKYVSIKVEVERSNGEQEAYMLWAQGNIQPALQVWDRKIEYGVRAVHARHRAEIKFTNTGSVPLGWTLAHESTKYLPMQKFEPLPLPKDAASIPPPMSFFPSTGRLLPGCTQSVDMDLTPSLAQYEVFGYYNLSTEDFAVTPIVVHGIGASSRLTIDVDTLDYGVMRVGTNKAFKFRMRNRGILPLKYFVECSNAQFSADPEQGLLDGDGQAEITVKFIPKSVGQVDTLLRILPSSAEGFSMEPLNVMLRGMGSYPELVVITRTVDFGTALFITRNVQPVRVENKGAAEAHIVFSCHHQGIELDGGEKGVVVAAHTTKDINIVYIPQVVEKLNVKAFLRSSDSRGDHFMLTLRGSVGVPKLTFAPEDILTNLDFGVCAANGIFKKTFTMTNEGNILLPYQLNLTHVKTLKHDAEGNILSTPGSSHNQVVTVEPTSGVLAVGDVVEIIITFVPDGLAEYEFNLQLNYEFRTSNAAIKGTGGRAVLKIDSPLNLIDFGTCRLARTFRKPLTIANEGNLGVHYYLRPQPSQGDWSIYDAEFAAANAEHLQGRESTTTADKPEIDKDKSHVTKELPGAITDLAEKQSDENGQPVLTEEIKVPEETVPEPFWVKQLASLGFSLINPNGYCTPYGKTDIMIQFSPIFEALVETRLRIYFGEHFEEIEICGRAASPRLTLCGPSGEPLTSTSGELRTLDLGVHPVNSEHIHALQLRNDGPFGLDYLVQPIAIREFEATPLRGFILPGSSKPLRVYFRPNSESKFHTTMKVMWEKEPLQVKLVASGGIGKLEVVFGDEKDAATNGLDFGMVPFNSSAEKRFFLFNVGMVEISMQADVDNDEYAISIVGDPVPYRPNLNSKALKPQSAAKRTVWNWFAQLRTLIPPGTGVEVVARFVARSPTIAAATIQVRSEGGTFLIPMRGKGGTIQLSHKGDLNMGDIATNHTYFRKIVIVNSGSIPSTLTAEWLVVGHSSEQSSNFVQLNESYAVLDPRAGWAKQQLMRERGVTEMNLTARDRWHLIEMMIRKTEVLSDDNSGGDPLSKLWGNTLGKLRSMLGPTAPQAPTNLSTLNTSAVGNIAASSSSTNIQPNQMSGAAGTSSTSMLSKKGGPTVNYSSQFKRRQMFFHLISSTQLTSQSLPMTRPYMRVEPASCVLPSFGEVTLNVEINLATEDTFLATLVVKPSVTNAPPHEISLTATPKSVNIICDDTRILNFHRQPLGESEMISRAFTNVGHKDINFKVNNPNSALTISPFRGTLKVGQTITMRFIFRPTDEIIQNGDVVFEPDISQSIRLKMFGGGGHTKASLSRYRRFDFGHCMIGKDTVSFLPIANEGNAILHLSRFELHETDTFFKGLEWPSGRVSLFPGKTYNLPIVFNPHEESPAPGRLIVGTNSEAWEIELIGLGREAVLIVSKVALEFSECLIGNSYEQKLGLKNVGDVNYPVTFKLEKEFPDIEFIPPSLIINPFTESEVVIAYTPSRETKLTVVLTISSPYSTHKVPLVLHAGTAVLQFSSELLDFGMFERTTSPQVKLGVKNIGTVRTSYSIRDTAKPSMFNIGHAKGILLPGKSSEIVITHVKHEVAQFEEKLVVRTDLIDKIYEIKVKGQCEEALLRAEEFNVLNMGICPVLENTTRAVVFANYGRYPLDFTVRNNYPLKVAPQSGVVLGGETSTFSVTWNPSGGYELRTTVAMLTNIGNFNIVVRGKAAFPELAIRNMYVDFGVCAVGHMYKESFGITNKGKVAVHFTIPTPRESPYMISALQGNLEPKETKDVDIYFKPMVTGRFAHTFAVECKGINNKEVVVVGVGGIMKLEFSPALLNLGRCPCELRVYHSMMLMNKGDVTLYINFKPEEPSGDRQCTITVPDQIILKPNRSTKCFFGIMANKVGNFMGKIKITTKEKTYYVTLTGVGIRIILTERSRRILDSEKLPAVSTDFHRMLEPFHSYDVA